MSRRCVFFNTCAQVAPSVRVSISEAFGLPPGATTPGQLTCALKKLGFDYVFGGYSLTHGHTQRTQNNLPLISLPMHAYSVQQRKQNATTMDMMLCVCVCVCVCVCTQIWCSLLTSPLWRKGVNSYTDWM